MTSAVYHSIITSDPDHAEDKPLDLSKYPVHLGITIELCAGIVDKSKSLDEIAKEEVIEECGYNVSVDRLEQILTYRFILLQRIKVYASEFSMK